MDVFSGILMISVNDRVCEGFAQCDLNVAIALRNTAALPEQEPELIHEGRNRRHFAWQRALQLDARAVVIVLSSLGNHLEGPNVNLSVALTLPDVGIDGNLQQIVHLPSPEISVGEELQPRVPVAVSSGRRTTATSLDLKIGR